MKTYPEIVADAVATIGGSGSQLDYIPEAQLYRVRFCNSSGIRETRFGTNRCDLLERLTGKTPDLRAAIDDLERELKRAKEAK